MPLEDLSIHPGSPEAVHIPAVSAGELDRLCPFLSEGTGKQDRSHLYAVAHFAFPQLHHSEINRPSAAGTPHDGLSQSECTQDPADIQFRSRHFGAVYQLRCR